MTAFEFDQAKSVEQNLEAFLDYLASVDEEFADILRDELPTMLPLPDGQDRTSVRKQFHAAVSKRLDAIDAAKSTGEQ